MKALLLGLAVAIACGLLIAFFWRIPPSQVADVEATEQVKGRASGFAHGLRDGEEDGLAAFDAAYDVAYEEGRRRGVEQGRQRNLILLGLEHDDGDAA